MSKSNAKREKKTRCLEAKGKELSRRRLCAGARCGVLTLSFLALFEIAQALAAKGIILGDGVIPVCVALFVLGCLLLRFAWGAFCECRDCHVELGKNLRARRKSIR